MKTVFAILGAAILISSAVMIFLVKKGAALRPAGVIQPAEIGTTPDLIGKSVGLRLFPDFQTAKNVVWYMDVTGENNELVPQSTLLNYQTNFKPTLEDLRAGAKPACTDNCWYVLKAGQSLPEDVAQRIKAEPTLEIYVQHFDRNEAVSQACESEKTLDLACMRPVSVREVKKKIKTPAPYFFMRRYLDSQFFLFIEK